MGVKNCFLYCDLSYSEAPWESLWGNPEDKPKSVGGYLFKKKRNKILSLIKIRIILILNSYELTK